MAVRIRMKRLGRRKRPFYRLVAIDSKVRREGSEVERLGWYDPLNKDSHFSINEDRIKHWLGIGAKASHAAKGLFKKAGLSYKWHLEKNGASEEEVAKLFEEWQNRQSIKAEKSKEIPVIEEIVDEKAEENSNEEVVEAAAESGDVEGTLVETASIEEIVEEKAEENSNEEVVEAAAESGDVEGTLVETTSIEEIVEEKAEENSNEEVVDAEAKTEEDSSEETTKEEPEAEKESAKEESK